MLKLINIIISRHFSSNTCTWSRTKTMTSNVNEGECDGKCWEEIYNWDTYQSPCNGDRGASLVIKESNRWVSNIITVLHYNFSARGSQNNVAKYVYFRFTTAGVFSACVLSSKDCCLDPVVHAKINSKVKKWIWNTADGVRESHGCPKKAVRSK